MGQAKGGIKLRRSSKHANMYAAQKYVTLENKQSRAQRRVRRLKTQPKQDFTHVLGGKNHNRVMRRVAQRTKQSQIKAMLESASPPVKSETTAVPATA